jgi:hypothetical protein
LRLELGERGEIAGIGYDGGELLELFQLGSHGRALSCGSSDITRALAGAQGRKCVRSFARAITWKQPFESSAVVLIWRAKSMAGSTQLPDNHVIALEPAPNTVGASLLAKNLNDNARFLNKRGA